MTPWFLEVVKKKKVPQHQIDGHVNCEVCLEHYVRDSDGRRYGSEVRNRGYGLIPMFEHNKAEVPH